MSETETAKTENGSKDGGGRPKRRWLRRLIVAGGVLLIVLVVLVLLVPTLLSTGAGKRWVLGVVNDQIAGEVDADGLSVGWLSGQSLTGVVVRDAGGVEVARVGRIELPDASLLSLVRGGLSLGELRVESVTADIVGYEDGTTNLQRAFAGRGVSSPPGKSPPGKSPPGKTPAGKTTAGRGGGTTDNAWPAGLSFGLTVRDVDISYRADGVAEPIRLTVSEADLSAMDPAHLVLKLNAELSQANREGSITADAQIDGLFDASGAYQPGKATARVDVQLSDLPVDLLDVLASLDGKLLALLGPVLNARVLTDVTTSGGTASVTVDSKHLDIDGKLAFDESGVSGVGTSHIRFTLTPDAWTVLTALDDKPASTLAGPVDITIELARFGLPINDRGLDLTNVSLDLDLNVGDTRLLIDSVGEVTLASTTGGISTTQLGKSLTVIFNTTSSINRKPGGVNVEIELTDLIDANQELNTAGLSAKIKGQLTNAPVAAILDELMPAVTHGLATRTLGPAIDATLNVNAAPRPDGKGVAGDFDVDLLTEGGEAGLTSALIGRFGYDKDAIHADLADGSYARFTLTPKLLEAYSQAFGESGGHNGTPDASAVSLGGPATFRLDLADASAQLLADDAGGYALDLSSVRLVGSLKSPKLVLEQGGKPAATLKGLLVDIATDGLAGDTTLTLNADIDYPVPPGGESRPGSIESTTTVSGLINAQGQFTFDSASYQTDTHIRRAPIDLIDALFDMQGELVASVGPKARVDAVGSYTPAPGPRNAPGIPAPGVPAPGAPGSPGEDQDFGTGGIDLKLKSRSASADLKLLIEDGRWTLKADAPLSFQVTPRLSQTMLKKVNPFLAGAVSAKLPIGVTIKQKGFSVPLRDADIADVNADILLELGELDLKGEGVLKKVLQQLGVGGRSLLNARFSPVTIHLAGGILSYQDLTMSIDDVVLGFSGQVDLSSERLDLRMTIPGTSLSKVPWLKGVIDPDQVIVIPLTGTFDKPAIDFKLLSGEIAKAALQGQLKGVAGDAIGDKIGGEAGAVLGGLLNDFLKGTKPQNDAPDTADGTAEETGEPPAQLDVQESSQKPAADTLTDEERKARRERRRKRRERLERLEREAQEQQP